jgi:hypothetical protein
VDNVALGRVFSEYFGFPCQSSFHLILKWRVDPVGLHPPPPLSELKKKDCSVDTAVLVFSSDAGCVVPLHICVSRGVACALLPRCV